jgi:hypothetical protein
MMARYGYVARIPLPDPPRSAVGPRGAAVVPVAYTRTLSIAYDWVPVVLLPGPRSAAVCPFCSEGPACRHARPVGAGPWSVFVGDAAPSPGEERRLARYEPLACECIRPGRIRLGATGVVVIRDGTRLTFAYLPRLSEHEADAFIDRLARRAASARQTLAAYLPVPCGYGFHGLGYDPTGRRFFRLVPTRSGTTRRPLPGRPGTLRRAAMDLLDTAVRCGFLPEDAGYDRLPVVPLGTVLAEEALLRLQAMDP